MSTLIERLERAVDGEFHADYSSQDYLSLCHEALLELKELSAELNLLKHGQTHTDAAKEAPAKPLGAKP
jgi:hypothetical protein